METITYVVGIVLVIVVVGLIIKSRNKKNAHATYYESNQSSGIMGKLKDFGSSCCNKIKNAVGV